MTFTNSVVGNGGSLVRQAIKSPNYTTGTAGWTINKDGSAEFNNVVIRGGEVISGTNLYYSGTPASGNLIASISATAGTDSFGNAYLVGVCSYDPAGNLYSQINGGKVFTGNLVGGVLDTAEAAALSAAQFVGQLELQSGLDNNNGDTDRSTFTLVPGSSTAQAPNGTEPSIYIQDSGNSAITSLGVSGAVIHTSTNGARIGIHTAAMQGTWVGGSSGSGSFGPLTWIYDAEDNVHINGTFHCTTTTPGTIIANGLPPGAIGANVSIAGVAVRFVGTAGTNLPVYLNSSGELRTVAAPTLAVGDSFMINVVVPRGRLWT